MEKEIGIKTSDGFIINGTLNWQTQDNALVIFIHGVTGHKDEHLFYNAVSYFTKKGYTTFRANLYGSGKKNRALIDCDITTHAKDVERMVSYFSKKFKHIFLVGHSLGGPSILFSNQRHVTACILWDGSIGLGRNHDWLVFDKKNNVYKANWGTQAILPKGIVDQWSNLGTNMIQKMKVPTKLIFAQKGILKNKWEKYLKEIPVPCDTVTIENADHCFNQEGCTPKLYKETYKWIKKYS